jgi:hypothetical protein
MATETRRKEIDLVSDLGGEIEDGAERTATLELTYEEDGGRTVTITHGVEEWTLEFEDGRCVNRDPPASAWPQCIDDAVGLVKSEIR